MTASLPNPINSLISLSTHTGPSAICEIYLYFHIFDALLNGNCDFDFGLLLGNVQKDNHCPIFTAISLHSRLSNSSSIVDSISVLLLCTGCQ